MTSPGRPGRAGERVLFRNLARPGCDPTDVLVSGGRVERIGGTQGARPASVVDLAGYAVLPPLVEPHVHLDKVFTADRFPQRDWTLLGAIEAWIASCAELEPDDLVARASRAVGRYLARGVTLMRAHVDTVPAMGLKGVEAAVEVRRRVAGSIDLQVVAGCFIPATGLLGAGNLARLRDAVAAGATCVGGFPSLDPDPAAAVEALAEVAASCGVGLDLHIDETSDPTVFALGRLIELAADGFPAPVTASHAVTLGLQPLERQHAVAAAMAEAGVGVVTLPQTNLLLQGRGAGSLAPRGLTALRPLLDAGVAVGAGGDNIQDGFNPLGRADPFETASLLVAAGHLTLDEALHAVTHGACRVLRPAGEGGPGRDRPPAAPEPGAADLRVGDRADFVAVRAGSVHEAVASASIDRLVVRGGEVIARTSTTTELALPGLATAGLAPAGRAPA